MASANSFLQGFTGGMGAMSNLIDAKARREALALQTQWAQEDRDHQMQQRKNQKVMQNAHGVMEIYNSLDTPEKQSAFTTKMFNHLNQDPTFSKALDSDLPTGQHRELKELRANRNGDITPYFALYEGEGENRKELGISPLKNADGQVMTQSSEQFFQTLGSMPGVVDAATASRAQILSLGGQAPEKPWRITERDGMLIAQQGQGGQPKSLGYTAAGRSNKSGTGSTDSRFGSTKFPIVLKNEDGSETHYNLIGDRVVQQDYGSGGNVVGKPLDVTKKFTDVESGALEDRVRRILFGDQPAPESAPTESNQPGTGILKPEALEQTAQDSGSKETGKGAQKPREPINDPQAYLSEQWGQIKKKGPSWDLIKNVGRGMSANSQQASANNQKFSDAGRIYGNRFPGKTLSDDPQAIDAIEDFAQTHQGSYPNTDQLQQILDRLEQARSNSGPVVVQAGGMQ